MPAESNDNNNNMSNSNKRATTKNPGASPAEQEQLACPRCESINTKFCYYNNYNFSQPRHFCKACRRYWTHGGTLRDIPVGGGTRKNAKRCRTLPSSSTTTGTMIATTGGNAGSVHQDYPLHATPVLLPFPGSSTQLKAANMNGSVGLCGNGSGGGFASLLSPHGQGFLALGGFGLGLGSGFVGDVGFAGHGRGAWGLAGVTDGGAGVAATNGGGGGGSGSAGGIGNTWQFENGEATSTFGTADCFSWPDLAISTPGNGLK